MKRILASILLVTVAALMLILCACTPGESNTDDTSASETEITTASGATDETTESGGISDGTTSLEGYKVILSDYASDWERSAANELSALIGAEILSDNSESGEKEILVGWTKRTENSKIDYDHLNVNGFTVTIIGEKYIVTANSAQGMKGALSFFTSGVEKTGESVFYKNGATNQAIPYEEDETVKLSGEWADSVAYAKSLENKVEEAFIGDGSRTQLNFSNLNMRLNYQLGVENKLVNSFTNTQGVPYFINTSDVFVKSSNGLTAWASDSSIDGRMNTYRMGYYYRDIHVLDLNFAVSGESGGIVDSKNVRPTKAKAFGVNMVSRGVENPDGSYSFTVEDPYDPYITWSTNYKAEDYNALKIVMKNTSATNATIYYVAGKETYYNSAQQISFSVKPGNEYQTYYVYFEAAPDYTGRVTGLRLDIGDIGGEVIDILSIEAVKMDYYSSGVQLDRTYHTYSDKLNEELHFVFAKDSDEVVEYGTEIKFDASRVLGIRIGDKNGVHESLDGVDMASVEYVAFDINRAGIIGFVKCVDTDEAKFNVVNADGYYTVTLSTELVPGTQFKAGDELYLGYRIYNDETHDFGAFLEEAYIERHPLTTLTVDTKTDGAKVLGYNALRGCYEIKVDGTSFNIYYSDPTKTFDMISEITGDAHDRKIYINGWSQAGGCVECAALLDANQKLLPLAIEVCKNFRGENEEPLYDAGDPDYGEAIFPMVLKANETKKFTLMHLYAYWGKYPLKQISSIQFIAPYYHLSCGTTESNCIAPYYVYGKDYWTLPDFRSMSAPFWSNQPQHTSVGRLHFLGYTDAEGNSYGSEFVTDNINSSGPLYADIDMSYISEDGKIKADYRHLEMPQYDENRTYYELDLQVLEDISIKDFANNFHFFYFDGRSVNFSKMGYLDTENKEKVVDLDLSKDFSEIIKLGSDCPYFDYFIGNAGDYVNFALLIKDAEIVIGGQKYEGGFAIKNDFIGTLNYCYLTLDLGDVTLKAGDTFKIDMILMPWGSQLVDNDNSVRTVRRDSCLNPVKTEVAKGTLIKDRYMSKIKAENNSAEFTLKDGGGTMTVRVYGFTDYKAPTVFEKIDGEWVEYNTSETTYDGYMVYYDGDGTYSYAFCVDMDTGASRTFKISN